MEKAKHWYDKHNMVMILLLCLMSIMFVLCIHMIIQHSENALYFNSDTASLNIYAHEEQLERKFFAEKWCSGNELLLFTPHIFILLFRCLGVSEFTAVICKSIVCILIITVLLFICLSKMFNSKTAVVMCTLLLGGISFEYEMYIIMQSSYCMILILVLFSLTCYCLSRSNHLSLTKTSWIIALYISLFISAACGYRYILYINIPIILTDALLRFKTSRVQTNRKEIMHFAFYIIVTTVGFIINRILSNLSYRSSSLIENNLVLCTGDRIEENFSRLIRAIIQLSGYESGIDLLSVRGICSIIALFSFLYIFIIAPIMIGINLKKQNHLTQSYFFVSLIALGLILFILIFTTFADSSAYSRYIMIPLLLMGPLGISFIWKACTGKYKTIMIGILVLLMASPFLHIYNWRERARTVFSQKDHCETMIEVLDNNDLTFGYSTYWNSHILTVCADSKIEVAPVRISKNGLTPFDILSPTRYYEDGYANGDVFILLTNNEDEEFQNRKEVYGEEKKKISVDEMSIVIYVYDYESIKVLLQK